MEILTSFPFPQNMSELDSRLMQQGNTLKKRLQQLCTLETNNDLPVMAYSFFYLRHNKGWEVWGVELAAVVTDVGADIQKVYWENRHWENMPSQCQWAHKECHSLYPASPNIIDCFGKSSASQRNCWIHHCFFLHCNLISQNIYQPSFVISFELYALYILTYIYYLKNVTDKLLLWMEVGL